MSEQSSDHFFHKVKQIIHCIKRVLAHLPIQDNILPFTNQALAW
ncbi:hypothetical protein AS4_37400 [Acinetobacter guillouiae]|nr:hypothetical protein AS4_37400 [Acinetobacter guillouiae]